MKNIIESFKKIIETPDKSKWKTTTSHVFKIGMLGFMSDIGLDKTVLELGSAQGHTTGYLSFLCNKIYATDVIEENCQKIKQLNLSNCKVLNSDIYSESFQDQIRSHVDKVDVTVIDAIHESENVFKDSLTGFNLGSEYFIYDDIGLIPEVKNGFERFLNYLNNKNISYETRNIGMPPGTVYNNTINKVLKDFEGKILIIKGKK